MIGARGRLAPLRRRDRHLDPDGSKLLGDGSPGERFHQMLISSRQRHFQSLERAVPIRGGQVEPVVLQVVLLILVEPARGTGGTMQ